MRQPKRRCTAKSQRDNRQSTTALIIPCDTGKPYDTFLKFDRRDGDDKLCQRCAKLDLKKVFNTRISQSLGDFVMDLGSQCVLESCTCILCNTFAKLFPANFDSKNSSLDGTCHLRAFSMNRTFAGPGWKTFLKDDSTILGVVKISHSMGKTGKDEASSKVLQSLSETGYLGIVKDAAPLKSFGIRLSCPDTFDLGFVHDVITYCTQNHGVICSGIDATKTLRSRDFMLDFKVIECSTRRIVKAVLGCRYIALSYLWGSGPCDYPTSAPGTNDAVLPTSCPRVVNDSIDIALKLGYEWLWVDRYCIDQQDPHGKAVQVSQMDKIYTNAHLTIIAAAGDGPDHGLPGVGEKARKTQVSVKVGELTLASSLPSVNWSIDASKWSTRGWTFQEGFLSKRRLIFTDHQVCFKCNTMSCAEVLRAPINALHRESRLEKGKKELRSSVPIDSFNRITLTGVALDIMKHLSAFTKRDLTYPSDAVNAFQGIFQVVARADNPTYQLVGIPILPHARNRKTNANLDPRRTLGESLALGLSWLHKKPSKRRKEFPSWSWAGWEGQIENTLLWSPIWELTEFDIRVKWVDSLNGKRFHMPGEYEAIDRCVFELHGFEDTIRYIGLEADIFFCEVTYINIDTEFDEEERRSKSSPSTSGSYAKIPIEGIASDVYAPISFDGDAAEHMNETLICVSCNSLGRWFVGNYPDGGWLLLLRDKVKYHERVGFASFQDGFLKESGSWSGAANWHLDGNSIRGFCTITVKIG